MRFLWSFPGGLAGHLDKNSITLFFVVGLEAHERREMLIKVHWYLLAGVAFPLKGQPGNCPDLAIRSANLVSNAVLHLSELKL